MQNSTPIISVIMPVFNGERYLKEAIDSILNQSFKDFEFIILNDGSTDSTENIILSYNDSRINYVLNEGNLGIVATLNKGINLARGLYIARMDADDISFPERLEMQYNYLISDPELVLCGSLAKAIDGSGNELYDIIKPIAYDLIKINQLFGNSFIHPSILIKTDIIKEFFYDVNCQYAEDYLLFTKVALKYKVGNINTPLLYYRVHDSNLTILKAEIMTEKEKVVLKFQLSQFIDNLSGNDVNIQHNLFSNYKVLRFSIKDIQNHLFNLKRKNQFYNIENLNTIIHNLFYDILYFNHKSLEYCFLTFVTSPIFSFKHATLKQLRRLFKLDIKNLVKK